MILSSRSMVQIGLELEKRKLALHDLNLSIHSALGFSLGYLYFAASEKNLEVPAQLCYSILAAAKQLRLETLEKAAITTMSHSLNARMISNCFKVSVHVCSETEWLVSLISASHLLVWIFQYSETEAIRLCDKRLEMNLTTEVSCSIHLRNIPLNLLSKLLTSPR